MEHLLITSLPDVKQRFVLCNFTLLRNMVYTSVRLVLRSCSSNEVQEYRQNLLRLLIRQLRERLLLHLTRYYTSSSNCLINELIHPHWQVRVPVANTLGKIGNGMQVILSNFNHERWMVVATSIPAQRLIVEECLKSVYGFGWDPCWMINDRLLFFIPRWSTQRIVFGKPLTSQAVIRAKLASMISRVEACQNWFEYTTYQMNNVSTAFHFDRAVRGDADQIWIDELQSAGWQARRSYWFIEAVRFPSYNSFKSLKFPGLYLGLDGKQQKVKPFCELLSFYCLPFNSLIQSQMLPKSLVDELSRLPGWVN